MSDSFKPRGRAHDWSEIAILSLLSISEDDYAKADKLWHRHTASAYRGMLSGNGFKFEPTTQTYIRANDREVSDSDAKRIALLFLLAIQWDMQHVTEQMTHGDIEIGDWQDYMAQTIKSLYLCEGAAAAGGFDDLTNDDLLTIRGEVGQGGLADSINRLKDFSAGVESSSPRADTREYVIYRAGLYADPAHVIFEGVKRDSHIRAINTEGKTLFNEERNILDDQAQHCASDAFTDGCPEVTDAGWVPIGTLPLPGERSCGPKCRCSMTYRKGIEDDDNKQTAKSFEYVFRKSGDGHWVTMDGVHVFIGSDGTIEKGPSHMIGKRPKSGGITKHHYGHTDPNISPAQAAVEEKYGKPKGNWKTPIELPGKNKGALPPVKSFKAPPMPKSESQVGGKAGGMSATGMTNTQLGDLAERVLGKKSEFKSLLPMGDRKNPLDAKWDEGDQGFEIKAVSTAAQEYKSAPKSNEVEAKLAYASQYGFTPNLIVAVVDTEKMSIHAYMRTGAVVGSLYKGGSLNDRTFGYLGSYKYTDADVAATVPESRK